MWKQIKNTRYEVSTNGDIKNSLTGRVLTQYKNNKGYKTIGLSVGSLKKTFLVHRLVAEAFIENYSEGLDVNHKNGLRFDNKLINLECVSRQANNDDRVFNFITGVDTINEIINYHNDGLTSEEIFSNLRVNAKLKYTKIKDTNRD
jgi:hypothetical protein